MIQYLGSAELQQLVTTLESSPDSVTILMTTLSQAIVQPAQVSLYIAYIQWESQTITNFCDD